MTRIFLDSTCQHTNRMRRHPLREDRHYTDTTAACFEGDDENQAILGEVLLEDVAYVAAGHWHCAAVTKEGRLFTVCPIHSRAQKLCWE